MFVFASLLAALSGVSGQAYCSSGPYLAEDTNLGTILLEQISDFSNCPKTIGPKDLTNLTADLVPGSLYDISYAVTTCGLYYPSVVAAWIDFNHNSVFEASENLFFEKHWAGLTNVKSFLVPSSVTYTGITRLRVQLQETDATTIDPCTNFAYGATKDFSVNLKPKSLYCTAGPTSPEDTHLGPLLLQGEKKDVVQYEIPCPGFLGPGNFTELTADLVPGNSYHLAFSVITCDKMYPNILSAVWIDYNGNFIWEDNEQILGPTNKFGAIMTTFTVPSSAKVGPTSMRTMVQEVSGVDKIGPCDNFKWGGTQDYPLQIISPRTVKDSETREPVMIKKADGIPTVNGMSFREAPPQSQSQPKKKGDCPKKRAALEAAAAMAASKKSGMGYREEAEAGMRSREEPPVVVEQTKPAGMSFREGPPPTRKKGECPKKKAAEAAAAAAAAAQRSGGGMMYREQANAGMSYREDSFTIVTPGGMAYREQREMMAAESRPTQTEEEQVNGGMTYREQAQVGMRFREMPAPVLSDITSSAAERLAFPEQRKREAGMRYRE